MSEPLTLRQLKALLAEQLPVAGLKDATQQIVLFAKAGDAAPTALESDAHVRDMVQQSLSPEDEVQIEVRNLFPKEGTPVRSHAVTLAASSLSRRPQAKGSSRANSRSSCASTTPVSPTRSSRKSPCFPSSPGKVRPTRPSSRAAASQPPHRAGQWGATPPAPVDTTAEPSARDSAEGPSGAHREASSPVVTDPATPPEGPEPEPIDLAGPPPSPASPSSPASPAAPDGHAPASPQGGRRARSWARAHTFHALDSSGCSSPTAASMAAATWPRTPSSPTRAPSEFSVQSFGDLGGSRMEAVHGRPIVGGSFHRTPRWQKQGTWLHPKDEASTDRGPDELFHPGDKKFGEKPVPGGSFNRTPRWEGGSGPASPSSTTNMSHFLSREGSISPPSSPSVRRVRPASAVGRRQLQSSQVVSPTAQRALAASLTGDLKVEVASGPNEPGKEPEERKVKAPEPSQQEHEGQWDARADDPSALLTDANLEAVNKKSALAWLLRTRDTVPDAIYVRPKTAESESTEAPEVDIVGLEKSNSSPIADAEPRREETLRPEALKDATQVVAGAPVARLAGQEASVVWNMAQAQKRLAEASGGAPKPRSVLVESPWLRFGEVASVSFRFYPAGDASAEPNQTTAYVWLSKPCSLPFTFLLRFGKSLQTALRFWPAGKTSYRLDVNWAQVVEELQACEGSLPVTFQVIQWLAPGTTEAQGVQAPEWGAALTMDMVKGDATVVG